MPQTKFLQLLINDRSADLPSLDKSEISIEYTLEEPEDFMTRQGSQSKSISLPATKNNDIIFNQFWNTKVEDLSPGQSFRNWMKCLLNVNGSIPLIYGYALLENATDTDKPEDYTITINGGSGSWIIDLENYTLWDCLSPTGIDSHVFNQGTVQGSWTNFRTGLEQYDYVYAPVRYRQPFDGTTLGYGGDDCVNIFHLRPSLSIYWLVIRAFRSLGYSINSQFFSTAYFKQLILLWTHGDFLDLNSQLIEGVCFKAAGELPASTEPPPISGRDIYGNPVPFWSGINSANASLAGSVGGSSWWIHSVDDSVGGYTPTAYHSTTGVASYTNGIPGGMVGSYNNGINATGGVYVFNGNGSTAGGNDWFKMDVDHPPAGYDNFLLYSFDASTGTMIYNFIPPTVIAATLLNLSATFVLSLYITMNYSGTGQGLFALECTHSFAIGGPDSITCQSILPSGGAMVGSGTFPQGTDQRYPLTPTVFNFTVANLNPGDTLKFRLRCLVGNVIGSGFTFGVFSGGYLNNNPSVLGVPSYQFNPVTQQYGYITPNAFWTPLYSTLTMTGFLIQVGNTVNFQNIDAFRNYRFLDFLGGLVDLFNLEIQTDAINKVVTIEPMFGSNLPTGEVCDGYFSTDKIFDWSQKRDWSKGKGKKSGNFNAIERQLDLTFKLDGSDGAQTIWGQRYKDVYLSNRTYTGGINSNNLNIDNGIIAGVPGSARYMLPNRFAKGNRQMANRFFSATMHAPFPQWNNINGAGSPTPQLITMFPNDASSSDAVSQAFLPKIAWYAGPMPIANIGGWRFLGDPNYPYNSTVATSFELPYAFAVDYSGYAKGAVLSYSDENVGGIIVPGLMRQFYLQRFAIIRNGQLDTLNVRLNLKDITNWEHRECIFIDGVLYALIQINNYKPLDDDSTEVTFWKVVAPMQTDLNNSYPSATSILVSPPTLTQYDLRYARLLLYPTDLPQIG